MTEPEVLLEAIRDANRHACHAMATLRDMRETGLVRKVERDLAKALDVLQAELDEAAES